MEKNAIKEYIYIYYIFIYIYLYIYLYIYKTESPAVQQKLTQHCKSMIHQLKKKNRKAKQRLSSI